MTYEGLQGNIRDLELPVIETFENIYADRDYTIRLEIGEFNSICPKTGLPDFGTMVIEYVPDRLCAETRSLKLYVTAFRNIGIFQENAANRVLDDFVKHVEPRRAVLTARFNTRGGIASVIHAEYPPPGDSKTTGTAGGVRKAP